MHWTKDNKQTTGMISKAFDNSGAVAHAAIVSYVNVGPDGAAGATGSLGSTKASGNLLGTALATWGKPASLNDVIMYYCMTIACLLSPTFRYISTQFINITINFNIIII